MTTMAATTSATVSMPPIAVDTAAFSTSATMPTAANTKETVKLTTPDAMEVIAFKVFRSLGSNAPSRYGPTLI